MLEHHNSLKFYEEVEDLNDEEELAVPCWLCCRQPKCHFFGGMVSHKIISHIMQMIATLDPGLTTTCSL